MSLRFAARPFTEIRLRPESLTLLAHLSGATSMLIRGERCAQVHYGERRPPKKKMVLSTHGAV